jgi:hypothetical protein
LKTGLILDGDSPLAHGHGLRIAPPQGDRIVFAGHHVAVMLVNQQRVLYRRCCIVFSAGRKEKTLMNSYHLLISFQFKAFV